MNQRKEMNRGAMSAAALLLVAITTLAVYWVTLEYPFVYDDEYSILRNTQLRSLGNFGSLSELFKGRFLVNLTLVLNYYFGAYDVFGYHVLNMLIHSINGWLVFLLSYLLLSKLTRFHQMTAALSALFASLVFTAHPVQTQAVTYIIQRAASMAALFYLTAVLFYIKARDCYRSRMATPNHRRILYPTLTVLCAVCAMLSKQNAASLPFVIMAIEYMLFENSWRAWKRKLPWFVAGVVLWIAFILFSLGAFHSAATGGTLVGNTLRLTQETHRIGRWQYLCTQFSVVSIYIRLLFLPVKQNLDYLYLFKDGFFDGLTPLAFLFLAGVLGTGVWLRKKQPIITYGILWFFIALSVESSIIPIKDAMYEHRLYLPMFGFVLIASYLLFSISPNKPYRLLPICICLLVALGATAHVRNKVWKDDLTLWSDVVRKSPHNSRGHYNQGLALFKRGNIEEAILSYRNALALNPDYAEAMNNLGAALDQSGRKGEVQTLYEKAIRLQPDYGDAYNNLGIYLYSQGMYEQAAKAFQKAVSLDPSNSDAFNNLAKVLVKWGNACCETGDYDKAIEVFRRMMKLLPENDGARYNCGNAYFKSDRYAEAILLYEQAIELNPRHASAHKNLAIALFHENKHEQAMKHCKKALDLGMDIPPDFIKTLKEHR